MPATHPLLWCGGHARPRALLLRQGPQPHLHPHSPISFNAILSDCIRAKKPDHVPDLFAELFDKHGITRDASLCFTGKTDKALEALKEMVDVKHIELHAVINATLDSLYKEGKPDEADELWKEMVEKGCARHVAAYNVRVMHRALHGKPEDVLELIGEMEAAGIKPDTITYPCLITCHCHAGQVEDAKAVYRGLRKKGFSPKASPYRIFLANLCENGDVKMGSEVFRDSLKLNKVPDFGTMKLLVEGMTKKLKMQEAKAVVDQVKKRFPENLVGGRKEVGEELRLIVDVEVSDNLEVA